MPIALALIVAAIGWAVWTKRLTIAELPPVILGVAGAALALRGNVIIGVAALAIAAAWFRGLSWRLFGLRSKQSNQFHIDGARWLLGVSANDDAERIRLRHRLLISENHPDRGGNDERAKELNEARDILLNEIAKKTL